jgi:hypothetical protein
MSDQDEGEIRCICGITEDDGFTIQCEKCFVWQHAICVDITSDNVPDLYFCDSCEPRPLNVEVVMTHLESYSSAAKASKGREGSEETQAGR